MDRDRVAGDRDHQGTFNPSEQRQWLSKGARREKAGWIYLHIEGEPRERGFQHGYLLATEIAECLRVRRAVWLHNTSLEWPELLKETARFLTPQIDPENREELLGIVEGLQATGVAVTLDDLVAHNAFMELEWYWWLEVLKKATGGATVVTPPKQSCSAFIATGSMTRDGGVVLGHNTMLDYVDTYCRVIADIAPANHDARFLDAAGVIVGLKAKGSAQSDRSGFVIRTSHLQSATEDQIALAA